MVGTIIKLLIGIMNGRPKEFKPIIFRGMDLAINKKCERRSIQLQSGVRKSEPLVIIIIIILERDIQCS